jgi:hypothetical protein
MDARMRYALSALAALGLTIAAFSAAAEPAVPIGSAVHVVNLVTAELARDTRSLRIGDRVGENEVIEVGSDGTGELELDDLTKLALGPGSRLVLDKFVYDSDRRTGSILIRLAKGTMRFITGIAEKPAYVIRVPQASITVRGTIFDLFVEGNGTSWLLLQEGGVRVCNEGGACRDMSEPGKLIRIAGSGEVGAPARWSVMPGIERISFDTAFPFVVDPPTVNRKPHFTRDQIVRSVPETQPVPEAKQPEPKPKRSSSNDQAKQKKSKQASKKDSDDDDDNDEGGRSSRRDRKEKSLFDRLRAGRGND